LQQCTVWAIHVVKAPELEGQAQTKTPQKVDLEGGGADAARPNCQTELLY
jgi:hypothetical protein